jgi:hypothetical protein
VKERVIEHVVQLSEQDRSGLAPYAAACKEWQAIFFEPIIWRHVIVGLKKDRIRKFEEYTYTSAPDREYRRKLVKW